MMIGKRSFAFSSVLNMVTQGVIFVLAFLCIPYMITKLGVEQFGLLSILWLFVGYFNFLDLGIGQATTKHLSELFAKGEKHEAARILRISLWLSFLLAIAGVIIVFSISYIGVENVVRISDSLHEESKTAIQWLGFCLPAVLVQGVLKAVPTSLNRFDIVNGFAVTSGIFQWVGSVAILYLGGSLRSVIVLTVVLRYVITGIYFVYTMRVIPEMLTQRSKNDKKTTSQLLSFGGWITIAQIVSPLLTFFERLLIGNILSISWVTFFSVPYDAVTKIVVISFSMATTLFPFISRNWINDEGKQLSKAFFMRSMKYVVILLLPLMILLVVFSHELLTFWLGADFSDKGTTVLQLLSVGIFFSALSQLPNAVLQGVGKPAFTAKLLLIEAPIYLLACYLLTARFGINGTAVAWMLRVSVECVFLTMAVLVIMKNIHIQFDSSYIYKGVLLSSVTGILLYSGKVFLLSMSLLIPFVVVILLIQAICTWVLLFDNYDRTRIKSFLRIA